MPPPAVPQSEWQEYDDMPHPWHPIVPPPVLAAATSKAATRCLADPREKALT